MRLKEAMEMEELTIKHPELKNHIDRVGAPFYEKMDELHFRF